jgi:hypothetical protein
MFDGFLLMKVRKRFDDGEKRKMAGTLGGIIKLIK